mmetsp:Transcript_23582/g.66177  ORF Transcript_23582/g.66177 Transcript_23582/m.66177 type:complete len:214 (-) Transcript_23582:845-1486(-)
MKLVVFNQLFIALALVPVMEMCILGTQTGCSTSVATGLSNQILDQMGANGYSIPSMDTTWVHCSGACIPRLQSSAASALEAAAQSKNDYITLNSATRSSAQQYLLYTWYQKGICGIGLAATPGTSDHEAGRSIDTSYYSYWKSTLEAYGWVQSYPGSDPVHFDYFSNTKDLSQENLVAFQQLWNKNNKDQIGEDGIYGPDTANAFYNSPCDGW